MNSPKLPPLVQQSADGAWIGIAHSLEHAQMFFEKVDELQLSSVLCIEVPRCSFVSGLAEAIEFYTKGEA